MIIDDDAKNSETVDSLDVGTQWGWLAWLHFFLLAH